MGDKKRERKRGDKLRVNFEVFDDLSGTNIIKLDRYDFEGFERSLRNLMRKLK